MATFFRPSAYQLLLSFSPPSHNLNQILLRPKSSWLARKKHTHSSSFNPSPQMANPARCQTDAQYPNGQPYYHPEEKPSIESSRLRLKKRTQSISSPQTPIPLPSSSAHPPHQKPKPNPLNLIRTFFANLNPAEERSPQLEKAPHVPNPQPPAGLFGRLRQLTKLYGSAALVIYGILGTLDFGLSFLTIYLVGAEHVRTAEDWLLEQLNWKRAHTSQSPPTTTNMPIEPSKIHDDNNMLWTTAVVAYTIHKTILLPVRIGLTAWITPPIVRSLRKRGWKIGRNVE